MSKYKTTIKNNLTDVERWLEANQPVKWQIIPTGTGVLPVYIVIAELLNAKQEEGK